MMKTLRIKKVLNENQADALRGKRLSNADYDVVINEDCDGYDAATGVLLFRFRKNAMSFETAKLGYESFKQSIQLTDGRGMAAGGNKPRINKDGTKSKIQVAEKVYSGNVGFMDAGAMIHYCRKTAFARQYFEKYKAGIPFVEAVDNLYKELCPEHHARQMNISNGTNRNYRIANTSFTTVTVNRNFQTAVHKDSGDFPEGFGNLCVYREGHYDGCYFCLPEYKVAIGLHTTDILFADVHRWHGNTPFENCSDDYMRVSFVMYYREYMYLCKQPKEELHNIKMNETGFMRL